MISTRLQMEWLFFWSRPGDLSFAVPRPLPESRSTSCLCLSPVSPDSSLAGGDDNSVPQKLLILDARSYTAAVANRAKGGGCECEGQGSHTLETVLSHLLLACFYSMPLFFSFCVLCFVFTSTKLRISLTIGRARMRLRIDFLERKQLHTQK